MRSIGVAAVARATLVASHVDFFEERIRPAVASGDNAIVEHPRRIAMAAVLVLAAISGVAMVRTADIEPATDVPDAEIWSGNAGATVETAVERTL